MRGPSADRAYIGHHEALRTGEGLSVDNITGVNIASVVSSQRRARNAIRAMPFFR